MKIVITGATGLVGRPLSAALRQAGHEVVALTRHPGREAAPTVAGVRAVGWDGRTVGPWTAELRGAGGVVNLAGASIGSRRWTAARKRELMASRVDSTAALVAAIGEAAPAERPPVLVNASGIDYYGHHDGEAQLDERAAPGDGFLAGLCVEWEAAARSAEALGTRVVLMRTAVVLAERALALRLLALPFRLFAGGPLGSGRQWFTWIHIDDLVGLYRLALEREDIAGAVNAVAPDVRRQHEVAREVGRVLRRPSWLPAPEPALRLVLGAQADLLLHGRRAVPARALDAGFDFHYPQIGPALAQALGGEAAPATTPSAARTDAPDAPGASTPSAASTACTASAAPGGRAA